MIPKELSLKIVLIIALVLVMTNLAVLNFWMFDNIASTRDLNSIKTELEKVKSIKSTSFNSDTCPNSCLVKINEASISTKITQPTLLPLTSSKTGDEQSLKEVIITLGSGNNRSDDWVEVPGVETYIDNTKYAKIKTVTFESSASIPDGNQTAYIRLFNATDKHPVWFSDVSFEGGGTRYLISKPITLDSGNKLYKVQMKSSLKHLTELYQSRIRIIFQ